jgi:phytoene dehydrogenase-like protein
MSSINNIIVVGGGISGLVCSAYLSKFGKRVTLLEKEEKTGGYFGSYWKEGFFFDIGIRAIENSGVLLPMLRELGLERVIELKKDPVTIGLDNKVVNFSSTDDFDWYRELLISYFPREAENIDSIFEDSKKVCEKMNFLYGRDFPIFTDINVSFKKLIFDILPWQSRVKRIFADIDSKSSIFGIDLQDYLKSKTKNDSLRMILSQHFFPGTPVFFGLGYARLFFDYLYPSYGMESIPVLLENYIRDNNCTICKGEQVTTIDFNSLRVRTASKNEYSADAIVWACDLKSLYKMMPDTTPGRETVLNGKAGESVFTVNIASLLPQDYFGKKNLSHSFYTPLPDGIDPEKRYDDPEYMMKTTFEISIPCLRTERLSKNEGTGLIVSTLIDYERFYLANKRSQYGYDKLKKKYSEQIIKSLSRLMPELPSSIKFVDVSTPLTLENRTGNSSGSIYGWALPPRSAPVTSNFKKFSNAMLTPFRNIYQIGQWSLSPSGAPTAILTAKLTAHKIAERPLFRFR